MFKNLKAMLKEEHEARCNKYTFYINNGYYPTWASAHRKNPDAGLKHYSTPAKWEAYTNGTITREKAVEIAIKRAFKELEKAEQKELEKLERAENAPDLEYMHISVEWCRNATWGMNPHAVSVSNNGTYAGMASGCGYDKLSAAIASALNQDASVMRMLYTAAENAIINGNAPERDTNGNYKYYNSLGYGSGYSILPYFEGGVGVSCFERIFNYCGYSFRSATSSKKYDFYTIYKNEV